MKKNPGQPMAAAERRLQAEARLKGRRTEDRGQRTELEWTRLVHELEVHQIELAMQNEELQQARARVDTLLAQYTDLYDFAPAGFLTLDREGTIRQLNLTGARLLGVERSRLVNRRFGQFVAESDRRAFSGFLDKVLASEVMEACEVTLPQDGQHPLFVRIEGTRSPDEQECLAVVLDRTERRRAEEQTRAAQAETQRLLALSDQSRRVLLSAAEDERHAMETLRALSSRQEAILAAVPDIIMEVDNRKVYTWANQAGFAFFGDDVVGKAADHYVEVKQGLYQTVQPLFSGQQDLLYLESWQRCQDGKKRLLAWWCRVLKDEKGNITGALSSARDITERNQAEEQIRQLNLTLEQRVRDRTAQLETANQELESFSYSVSHDLRAPLRAIDGFARILEEDHTARLDDEGRRVLGTICGEAKRMGQLIDDLLAFSRMSRQHVSSAQIDMAALAQVVFDGCATQAPSRQLRLKLQPLPPAQGDQAMLRQVLTNLLSNALKYTRPRPVAEIEIGGRTEGGEHVYYVKDNGVGFDMKYAGKLFGVFQRLHTEDEFEGTGVGLALVQRVIHRHGGRVWAEAKLNEGSTFYFTLPTTKDGT